jgi:hypothetical protein
MSQTTLSRYRDAQQEYLSALATTSDPDLIGELPLYARDLVEALDAASLSHPELIAEVAEENIAWPVMAARHLPRGYDFAALADRIRLGSKVVVSTSPRATYRFDTPLNRWLLSVLLHDYFATPAEFYFLRRPDHQPRLTRQTLPWFLDDRLMPLLDDLRHREGDWSGVPALAALVAGITHPQRQRHVVRHHLKNALLDLAGREKEAA